MNRSGISFGDGAPHQVVRHRHHQRVERLGVGDFVQGTAVHIDVECLADRGERPGVGGRPEHPRAVDVDVTGGVADEGEDRVGRRGDAPRYRDPVR